MNILESELLLNYLRYISYERINYETKTGIYEVTKESSKVIKNSY